MKINARERDGVTILEPKGKITIGVGDVALREAVHEAVDAGATKILVNLKDVSTIDSSGIGELVAAFTTVANKGGKLSLFGIHRRSTTSCRSRSWSAFSTSSTMKTKALHI